MAKRVRGDVRGDVDGVRNDEELSNHLSSVLKQLLEVHRVDTEGYKVPLAACSKKEQGCFLFYFERDDEINDEKVCMNGRCQQKRETPLSDDDLPSSDK